MYNAYMVYTIAVQFNKNGNSVTFVLLSITFCCLVFFRMQKENIKSLKLKLCKKYNKPEWKSCILPKSLFSQNSMFGSIPFQIFNIIQALSLMCFMRGGLSHNITVHGHTYSSPSIFNYIFHIKPHFFQKNILKLSLGRFLWNLF